MQFNNWENIQNLLVVCSADLENLIPALSRIQSAFPQLEITLLTAETRSLCFLPKLNLVISYQPNWQDPKQEKQLIQTLKKLELNAAIFFTPRTESPYPFAYLCYLAGVPIRIGQSPEFGGSVLSHWVKPSLDDLPNINPYLAFLDSLEFPNIQPKDYAKTQNFNLAHTR